MRKTMARSAIQLTLQLILMLDLDQLELAPEWTRDIWLRTRRDPRTWWHNRELRPDCPGYLRVHLRARLVMQRAELRQPPVNYPLVVVTLCCHDAASRKSPAI
jgi:hypothetical protein